MANIEKLTTIEPGFLAQRRAPASEPVGLLPAEFEGFSSFLRVYWDVVYKHRWQIVAITVAAITVMAIYSFKASPIYRATAHVEIEAESPLTMSVTDPFRAMPADEAFLKTQALVVGSDHLAWQTIQQLELAENAAFIRPTAKDPFGQRTEEPRMLRGRLVRAFQHSTIVQLTPNSHMMEVSFESTNPDLGAKVVNTLLANYIEYNFRKRYDATRQASGFMEQQLEELRAKVEKSQQALVSYERQNSIVNVSDKQNVVEQRLSDLSRDLTAAESDLAQKESLYQMVQSNPAQIASLAQNEVLQKLQEKSADLKAEYVGALGQYGPNFPKVTRARDQVAQIQSLIEQEQKRTVERIQKDYEGASTRVRLVTASVAQQKVEVGRLNQLLIQHNLLQREFQTNQQLYEDLLQRLKDATVSAGLRATNIHIVDPANPPAIPVRPNKVLNLVIALLAGASLGIILAFAEEGLEHRSIRTPDDVERLLGIPALALIPSAALPVRRYGSLKRSGAQPEAQGRGESVAIMMLTKPTSAVAESYRALRSAILFSSTPEPPKLLLVASSQPREGKTCTSINLALSLAQNGVPVLIIDADLRKPGVTSELGLVGAKGLSGVLAGAYSLDEAIRAVDNTSLWVLPAGPTPPNAAEMLSSPTMRKLITELAERFKHVVIDSPPLLMVTDATILSTMVDGTILVAESGVTSPGALARSHRILAVAGARVLGVVVNKVDFQQEGYYYGSLYRYYGSYYGYYGRGENGESASH
jgi:polysaccharide biosynthesis transport protein